MVLPVEEVLFLADGQAIVGLVEIESLVDKMKMIMRTISSGCFSSHDAGKFYMLSVCWSRYLFNNILVYEGVRRSRSWTIGEFSNCRHKVYKSKGSRTRREDHKAFGFNL